MPTKTTKDIISNLLTVYDPRVRAAFMASVRDIANASVLKVLVKKLEQGDVIGAVEAMHLDADAFSRLELAIGEAYNAGGSATVGQMPPVKDDDGNRVLFHWSIRNIGGENWLRDHSASLVTRIVDDQREAIRASFTEGLMVGNNPTQTALNVIGRVSKATGNREGGIIGLTSPQERFVSNARAELLSGDPERMANYFTRTRRDKRFDRTVAKAIREGKAVDLNTVNTITGRYADRLLQLRGDTIGLNETMNALSRSRRDAIAQQIASGKVDATDVRKIWKHTPQEHPRLHHAKMNGHSVRWDEPFTLPNGVQMDFPHSPDAPANETLGCKCTYNYKIDYFGSVVRRYKRAA